MYKQLITTACFGLVMSGATVVAQTPPQKPGASPASAKDDGAEHRKGEMKAQDEILAAMLIVENRNEIALAQLAQQRATDPDVKAFAKQLETDHTAFGEKLAACCKADLGAVDEKSGRDMPGSRDGTKDVPSTSKSGGEVDKSDKRAVNKAGETGEARSLSTPADHIGLIKELGAKCLESSKRALGDRQGVAFDTAYIGMQVMSHQRCLDTMNVLMAYSTDELRTTLEAGSKTVQTHLDHAKKIAMRQEKAPRAESAGG